MIGVGVDFVIEDGVPDDPKVGELACCVDGTFILYSGTQWITLVPDDSTPCDVEPDDYEPDPYFDPADTDYSTDNFDDDGGFVLSPDDSSYSISIGPGVNGSVSGSSGGIAVNTGMFDPSVFTTGQEPDAIMCDTRTEYVIRDKSSDQLLSFDGMLTPDVRKAMLYAKESDAESVRKGFDHSSDYDVRPIVIALTVI